MMHLQVHLQFVLQLVLLLKLLSGKVVGNEIQQQQQEHSNLSVYLLTYNVGTADPPTDFANLFDNFKKLHDIYVIALQELPELIIVTGNDKYMANLDMAFQKRKYVRLIKKRMTITAIYVYVRHQEMKSFTDVAKAKVSTKWHRAKGGVAVKMTYQGVSMVFVGAHFTAFDENFKKRIQDYKYITKNIKFDGGDGIHDKDLIVFLGDLNWRIDSSLSTKLTWYLIQKQDWKQLIQHDQLNMAKSQDKAFQGFDEPTINFPPSYKFYVSTSSYDFKQKPSYTDRILFKVNSDNLAVQTSNYRCLAQYRGSDHKPVRAVMTILFK